VIKEKTLTIELSHENPLGDGYFYAMLDEELCDRMPSDHRIRVAADYDLDAGMVTTCQSSDNAWWSYRLRDLSVAA